MRHKLGVIETAVPPTAGNPRPQAKHFNIQLALSDSEYLAIAAAHDAVCYFADDAHFFDMVRWNYEDLLVLLDSYEAVEGGLRVPSLEKRPGEVNLTRSILNFLASMRSFLDHSETGLKRRHGANSERLRLFKSRCSGAYDQSFAYRFLYRLRNFAQHCGVPVSAVTYHSSLAGGQRLGIVAKRDHLLARFDWGPITKEVQALPESINLEPYLEEVFALLDRLNNDSISDALPEVQAQARLLLDMVRRIDYSGGMPAVFHEDDADVSILPDGGKAIKLRFTVLQVRIAAQLLTFPLRGAA